MIQFNMLPDVKVEYIRTQKTKRMVMLGSFIAAGVSALILIMMFSYQATQKHHLSNLNKDISSIKGELEGNKDLTKMLSVQNQLNTLPGLYNGRPAADRLTGYIEQTTPTGVSIGSIIVDFSTSKVELKGTADSLKSVNEHVDTLKFTKFQLSGDQPGGDPASSFKDIVLANFNKSKQNAGSAGAEVTTFSISFAFDPQIFDETKNIELLIPSITTTRAQEGNTSSLFNGSTGEGSQQ